MREHEIEVTSFWRENERCLKPFSTAKPRVPLTFWLDDHYLRGIVHMPSTARYYTDLDYRLDVHKECNRILVPALGRPFYSEDALAYQKAEFEVVCGAHRVISEGATPWIESSITSIEEVKALIQKLSTIDMRTIAVSDQKRAMRREFEARTGARLRFEHAPNGPATLACNILGTTNVCYFMVDEPSVMRDFFQVLCDRYIEYHEAVLMEDNGRIDRTGVGVNDDCCYLFPPRLYERLCAPFLDQFFRAFAPGLHHKRRQHSDSAMGHLMPILNDLGVNEVNFGPTIEPLDIRRAMPHAVIHGQMPPLVLRDGSAEEIIATVRRDIEDIGADGGLVECPAGAVVNGTSMDSLRVYMWAVETYGRYV